MSVRIAAVPIWARAWSALSVLWLLLRAAGVLRSLPLCVFLIALSASVCYGLETLLPSDPSRVTLTFRRVVLTLLIVGIPVLIDPATAETVNVARFALVVTAAVALLSSWVVDRLWTNRSPRWVNGLQWPVLAVLVWVVISSVASEDRRVSLLGAYGSYQGLFLLAALVVVEVAVADAFRLEDLRKVLRVVAVASVPVVVYGLIQIHDQLLGGRHWEFISWQAPETHAFSTFGNPDHLAGYLATVLGITAVAAILSRGTLRHVLAFTALLNVVVLVQTAGRGGWAGALVVAVVLLAGYGRSVLAHPRTAALMGVGVAVGVIGFVVGAHRIVGDKLSTLFSVGAGTTVAQRFGYWGAAIHAGSHHLLTGTGPDTYSIVYQRYQSRSLASTLGLNFYVNGAHDVFLGTFSDQGVIGLVLLVALVLWALWWVVATWRLSTAEESTDVRVSADASATVALRRSLSVALLAALAAYVVQASFDTLQVGTVFQFWLLLGLLGALLLSTWPREELLLAPWRSSWQLDHVRLLRAEDDESLPSLEPRAVTASRRRGRTRISGWVPVVVVGGIAAVSVISWRDIAPWRADHAYWAASRTPAAGSSSDATIVRHLLDAEAINPWEPTYDERLGQLALNSFDAAPGADRIDYLNRAVGYLGDAATLQPLNASVALNYARALVLLAQIQPSPQTLDRALAALRQAAEDDPYNGTINRLLSTLKSLRG